MEWIPLFLLVGEAERVGLGKRSLLLFLDQSEIVGDVFFSGRFLHSHHHESISLLRHFSLHSNKSTALFHGSDGLNGLFEMSVGVLLIYLPTPPTLSLCNQLVFGGRESALPLQLRKAFETVQKLNWLQFFAEIRKVGELGRSLILPGDQGIELGLN